LFWIYEFLLKLLLALPLLPLKFPDLEMPLPWVAGEAFVPLFWLVVILFGVAPLLILLYPGEKLFLLGSLETLTKSLLCFP
jgi:hypothetical protein